MKISDEQLEHLGEFYCSDYVAEQMPWIKEVPFHVWLERETEPRRRILSKPLETCN